MCLYLCVCLCVSVSVSSRARTLVLKHIHCTAHTSAPLFPVTLQQKWLSFCPSTAGPTLIYRSGIAAMPYIDHRAYFLCPTTIARTWYFLPPPYPYGLRP